MPKQAFQVLLTLALSVPGGHAAEALNSNTPPGIATTNPIVRALVPPRDPAAIQDYQRMLELLHIKVPGSLPSPAEDPNRPPNTRPGAGLSLNWTDGVRGHTIVRSNWGRWSNYDEAKADCYPLPDPLRLNNGQRVTNAAAWWTRRRPEILEDFQREIYGRIPTNTPKVTWEVTAIKTNAASSKALLKTLVGHVDNSAYPAINVNLELELVLPWSASGPVPVVLIGGFAQGGRRVGPDFGFGRIAGAHPRIIAQLLEKGWGYAAFNTLSVQADTGAGLTKGIIGLVNHGQPRKPDDWGVLAAWAWGLSRCLDYLETDPGVDAKKVGLEGHSRWGKEALVAMAYDPRFAIIYASCSGEGGAKLHRHDIGESVDNLCGEREYHWMAGNFLKYAGHWNDLPVDAHELIALIAPRPVFITGGTQDLWADPVGEFKACVAAGPVYKLLGKRDLGTTAMPAPDIELLSGEIAYRWHTGGHSNPPDWPTFIKFAAKYF